MQAEHMLSKPMKKASKEVYAKYIKCKMNSIGNIYSTMWDVSTHEPVKWVLYLPMLHWNIDILHVHTSLKSNRTTIINSISFRKDASWWYKYICIKFYWQIWKLTR